MSIYNTRIFLAQGMVRKSYEEYNLALRDAEAKLKKLKARKTQGEKTRQDIAEITILAETLKALISCFRPLQDAIANFIDIDPPAEMVKELEVLNQAVDFYRENDL